MSDGKPAPQNIQDAFLNTVRREKATVVIYLLNGAKLTGRIRSFDKFSILLEAGSHEQLVFNTPSQRSLCQDAEAENLRNSGSVGASSGEYHDNLLRKPSDQSGDSPES